MTTSLTMLGTLLRDKSGGIALETALVSPILVLLLVGFIDFGMALHHKTQLESAARAGMQQALVAPDPASISAAALAMLQDRSDSTVTVVETCRCGAASHSCTGTCPDGFQPAKYISVSVSQPFDPPIGLLEIDALRAAEGEASVRIE